MATGTGCTQCGMGTASLGGVSPATTNACTACGATPGGARSGVSFSNEERSACVCSRGFEISMNNISACVPKPGGEAVWDVMPPHRAPTISCLAAGTELRTHAVRACCSPITDTRAPPVLVACPKRRQV